MNTPVRSNIFHALSAPTRRGIMEALSDNGSMSATDIGSSFKGSSRISSPAISQHLNVLLGAHLVRVEKHGRNRIYTVNPDALLDFESWLRRTRQEWEKRFDALEILLKDDLKDQH